MPVPIKLWQIEAGFRCLKDELEAGPIYHWKDRRIRAHIMVCFFALILRIAGAGLRVLLQIPRKRSVNSYRTIYSTNVETSGLLGTPVF